MTALSESLLPTLIHDVFSLSILTYLHFSWVRKPVLDSILPSGSLCLNLKRLCSYYWKETLKIIISEHLITSSKLSHTISTLDSITCNMEGRMKLINRLSSPSD